MFLCFRHVKWYGTGVARTCAPAAPAALSISTPSPSNISIPSTPHYLLSIPHPPLPSSSLQNIPSTAERQHQSTTTPKITTNMADMATNLGRNILKKYTGKGKAPAIDLDQHNDDSSSTERSRDQPCKTESTYVDVTRNEH